MVTVATSIGRSGLQDWILQRATALIMLAYCIYLDCKFFLNFCFTDVQVTYADWIEFADTFGFKAFTLLTVISVIVHAWIGMWTVSTDYMKSTFVRISFQLFVAILFFAYIAWTFQILWGS